MHFNTRVVRFLLGLAALLGLTALSTPVLAATYYVRTDGGTAAQCTGTKDAAYSGSGSAQACAWDSLQEALPPGYPGDGAANVRVKDGDTIIIDGGTYMMGYGSPGASACSTSYTYACDLEQQMPNNLTIAGASCTNYPVLWGTQGVYNLIDVSGTTGVTVKCLELTDHSSCIVNYVPTKNTGGVKACASGDAYANQGILGKGATNLTLENLNIHGFANQGVNIGSLRGTTTVTNVTIRANGWAGWNGDLGGNNNSSSNSGTLTFTNLDVEWNGCSEAYPTTTIVGCWGQNEGGYGDGFSESETGGTWIFSNSAFANNTQDGLDLLYADGTGSITMDRLYASENAGNGIKTSGTATLTNSIVNGYCNDWAGFPIAGDYSTGVSGTMCRADGTAVVMEFAAASSESVTLAYNTITGDGDTLFVGGSEYGSPPNSSDVTTFSNNIFLGQASVIPRDGGAPTALDYYATSDGSAYKGTVNYQDNIIWNVKNNFCPSGNICKDPQLTNKTMAAFNAKPLVSSPAIGNASSAYTVQVDYYGNTRPTQGATIGAVEYQGSSSSQTGTPTANFTYSASGLTVNFTDTSTDTGGTLGSWSWSFGDGASSSAQSPSHTYAAAGTYQVSEVVTDKASGKTSTQTAQVVVSAPQPVGGTPSANFTYSASGLTVNFTDTSTDTGGSIGSWSWSFGDGASSSAQSPSHTYAAAGTYQVSEVVTDKVNGKTSTRTAQVVVTAPQPLIGQGTSDSPLPPNGGTKPASDAPVPASPGTATPQPVLNNGGQHPGVSRGGMQTGLNPERSVRPGRAGWVGQTDVPNQIQSGRTAVKPDATQAVHDANVAAPVVSTAQSEIPAVRAEPATRSYVSVVYGWFADVYSQYRQMLSRWSR